jgi:hypothetical protein
MPRLFPPLRPKRPATESIPEPLKIGEPMPAPVSPLSFAPELACSPSVFVKVEKNDQSQATDVATQTQAEPSVTPAHDSTAIAAAIPCTVDSEPLYPELASSDPTCWPSEVYNRTSTMWLLPPHSNQSSAIATLLQAEIQSHNTTREMLHTTEQRRLEAVQRSNRFASDAQGWAAAYNNLNTALGKCAEEYSRVAAENVTLKSQMRCFKVSLAEPLQAQVDSSQDYLHNTPPSSDDQICILQTGQAGRQDMSESSAGPVTFETFDKSGGTGNLLHYEPCYDSECSEGPYSPEV